MLLDTLITQLIALLQRDSSRAFIAQQIVRWLETEHPLKAKILPTEWLGEHSAELVSDAVNSCWMTSVTIGRIRSATPSIAPR